MITIILMAILMMSVVGTVMFTMMTMVDQAASLASAQTEKQTLDIAEAVVINRLKPIGENQQLVAEIGVYGENHQEIPANWGIKTSNTYGYKLIYCPIGEDIDPTVLGLNNGNVKINQDNDYAVRYKTYFNGENYVVQSNFERDPSYADKDVIALIISPKSGDKVDCNSAYLETSDGQSKYRIKQEDGAGKVVAITKDTVLSYRANQPIVVKTSENNGASLSGLTDYWQSIHPLRFTAHIDQESQIDFGEQNIEMRNLFPGKNEEIRIHGNSESASIINAPTHKTITFENVSVIVDNVSFTGEVKFNLINSDVKFLNTSVDGEIVAENSKVTFEGASVYGGVKLINSSAISKQSNMFSKSLNLTWMSSSAALHLINSSFSDYGQTIISTNSIGNNAVYASGSKIGLNGTETSISTRNVSARAISLSNNSDLSIEQTQLSVSSNGIANDEYIYIGDGSRLTAINSQINSSGPIARLIQASGDVSLESTNITTGNTVNTIISLDGGSRLTISGSSAIGSGSGANRGVVANDGNVVLGSGAHIYASICWSGEPFKFSGSQGTGSSYKDDPLENYDDIYATINRSNWICN